MCVHACMRVCVCVLKVSKGCGDKCLHLAGQNFMCKYPRLGKTCVTCPSLPQVMMESHYGQERHCPINTFKVGVVYRNVDDMHVACMSYSMLSTYSIHIHGTCMMYSCKTFMYNILFCCVRGRL